MAAHGSALPDSGLYVLVLHVPGSTTVEVGALGEHLLSPGVYLYVGSAQPGLARRVQRHLAPRKPLRWHIDALTTQPGIRRLGAALLHAPATSECRLNEAVGLGHAEAARDLRDRFPLRQRHLRLPQFADDLLRAVPLPGHADSPRPPRILS